MSGLLLLISALLLLESTEGNKKYDQLSQHETQIIDKAIKEANMKFGKTKHLDVASISKTDDECELRVMLKPTSCGKTTPSVHRKECKILNQSPQVSCVECRGSMTCSLLTESSKVKHFSSVRRRSSPELKHY